MNRFFGTDWKAQTTKFEKDCLKKMQTAVKANIYISCVDNVAARFEIAEILTALSVNQLHRNEPKYWMDFGNGQFTGQVILSTIGAIHQPKSSKYEPVSLLPFITEEFGDLLQRSETADTTPSCSLAEALEKQDLFINATLAQMGCGLLWRLFRKGMTDVRGFFLNLDSFSSQPIKVG